MPVISKVVVNPGGIDRLAATEVAPWLQVEILEPSARNARQLVNVDTGFLRSTISTSISVAGRKIVGHVFNAADYGLWQETEPGDEIPGRGTRQRPGGKPHLRPGVLAAVAAAGARGTARI